MHVYPHKCPDLVPDWHQRDIWLDQVSFDQFSLTTVFIFVRNSRVYVYKKAVDVTDNDENNVVNTICEMDINRFPCKHHIMLQPFFLEKYGKCTENVHARH